MAFDSHDNGFPVAWFLTGSGIVENLQQFLTAFLERCRQQEPGFKPACMDNDETEQAAVR